MAVFTGIEKLEKRTMAQNSHFIIGKKSLDTEKNNNV